jgi:hypothetical protein
LRRALDEFGRRTPQHFLGLHERNFEMLTRQRPA